MVTHTGTTSRPDHLRALNEPRPVRVIAEDGYPRAIIGTLGRDLVEAVQDMWIVQDEWWREEIYRQYYVVLLQSGQVRTMYHDLMTNDWYEQGY